MLELISQTAPPASGRRLAFARAPHQAAIGVSLAGMPWLPDGFRARLNGVMANPATTADTLLVTADALDCALPTTPPARLPALRRLASALRDAAPCYAATSVTAPDQPAGTLASALIPPRRVMVRGHGTGTAISGIIWRGRIVQYRVKMDADGLLQMADPADIELLAETPAPALDQVPA